MNLIIVESPTKAKTLGRFLGAGYTVEASFGHVRDLPQKKLGINIEKNFEPDYVQTDKQKKKVEELKKLGGEADKIYLATDPDREGEAIAWHVSQVLDTKGEISRVTFHEITERAVKEAMENPREIDMPLVEAQQARRILDRLVGYKLSPLLWRKVRRGLSAGRVQSVAVRLVVEREKEISDFVPEEYWNIGAVLEGQEGKFTVQLTEKDGKKLKIENAADAESTEKDLKEADYKVLKVQPREVRRTPSAPFTTSTMQQTAANRLGWSAKRTMQVAQGLYEEGLITYHRTDSTNLAGEAVEAAAKFLRGNFGDEYALDKPRLYATKNKVAQEAHEAIRPTDLEKVPGSGNLGLSNKDEYKLYELIWKRFVACQAAEAVGEETKVSVEGKKEETVYGLEAKGVSLVFPGWLKVYGMEESEENGGNGNNGNGIAFWAGGTAVLPKLTEAELLKLAEITKQQKFTQPPARYNDASLIKALEEMGIGRPSTYAPILTTIQDRQYVEKIEKRFKPTALGDAVNSFLVGNFSGVVDYKFTAQMEDDLDNIANGEKKWRDVLKEFYTPFSEILDKVGETSARVKVAVEETGEKCPKCSEGQVVIRIGRFGRFLSCSRYPDCDYKANFVNKIGVACPKCGGDVIVRRTKSRKTFYGCSNYPKCDFASWVKPVAKTGETPVPGGDLIK